MEIPAHIPLDPRAGSFGLGTYQQQLASTMLAPLALAAISVVVFVGRSCCGCGPKGCRAGILSALPWLLALSFLVFPMVRSAARHARRRLGVLA